MYQPMRHPSYATSLTGRLKLIAGIMVAVLLVGFATDVSAQTTSEPGVPPLPSVDAQQQHQASAPASTVASVPALPLGPDGVRDVQSQLIALGFDPGAADGEAGPATIAAAQQYNENRGGSGPVPIDGTLLARLQQDTAPRLTPEQVAARTQPHSHATARSNPLTNMMQQFQSNLRTLFNGGY
jgi:peptidoglycan hydrolase-like protein with peptidoglycan-binding domain